MSASALLLLLAAPAAGLPGVNGTFAQKTEDLHVAIANKASDFDLKLQGDELAADMPRTRIAVHVRTSMPPQEPAAPDKTPEIDDLFTAGQKRIEQSREIPPPALKEAVEMADRFRHGRMIRWAELKANQLGVFQWIRNTSDEWIGLNHKLQALAPYLGWPFTFAVVVHEGGHALDKLLGLLTGNNVIDGELRAFGRQWWYLKVIDPTGHQLAQKRQQLAAFVRRNPRNKDARDALAVATSMDVLRGMSLKDEEPDPEKLRKYIIEIGYREGREHLEGERPSA